MSPKARKLLHPVESPAKHALVFICQKCGKRVGDSDKNVSHRLASRFKRQLKSEFNKGDVRIALTTCMDICPDDGVAVAIQSNAAGVAPAFVVVYIDDVDASSEALVDAVRRSQRTDSQPE